MNRDESDASEVVNDREAASIENLLTEGRTFQSSELKIWTVLHLYFGKPKYEVENSELITW